MENTKTQTKLAILGGRPAGYVAAIRASQLGANVVLIEENELGGVCLHEGCIPTKALLKSSDITSMAQASKSFGINVTLEQINWDVAINRKNRIVKSLNVGVSALMKKNDVQVIRGTGRVLSNHHIHVTSTEGLTDITAEKILLATGSQTIIPKISGFDLPGVISSHKLLRWSNYQKKLSSLVPV